MSNNYFIRLSYEGTSFHGWQVQKNARHTVQAILNQVLSTGLRENIETTGCGRTDTGVHASDFYADFLSMHGQLHRDADKWIHKFNRMLPPQISVKEIRKVNAGASARWDAVKRTYIYRITRKKDPFLLNRAWYLYGPLDLALMQKASSILKEYDDFAAFCKTGGQQKSTICKIHRAEWKEEGDQLVFTITADRFLRNMVRAIVGTVTDVGKGKTSLPGFRTIIEKKKRTGAGLSVPACGLYLTKVEYPSSVFKA